MSTPFTLGAASDRLTALFSCSFWSTVPSVRRISDLWATLAAGSGFNSDVGGYGFLALAVMIFGNWKPLPILGASLFFALFKVIAALNATLTFLPKFDGVKEISNFYQMLPYIVTMIVLIFTSKNSQAPKAEGIPYDKGSR